MARMARRLFIFDDPDRFLAGTVGEPGDRAFFLQARKGGAVVSVGLEKTQVAGAEEHELDEPVVEVFKVGAMALAWDAGTDAVVIEAQTPTDDGEYAELPDDAEEGPDLLRVRIDAASARGFVQRAEALLGAGRPACPFCGQPLDPQGHFCPRGNGQLN